jgi:TonB family protein
MFTLTQRTGTQGPFREERQKMTWTWRELYNAALFEKDRGKFAERLVAAEKAILQRMQELPDTTEEIPEGRALREALDCLYARRPQEFHPPGQIVDEEDFRGRARNWTRLATAVALGVLLLFATERVIKRNNAGNGARRLRTLVETYAPGNPIDGTVVGPADNPASGAFPHNGSNSRLTPRATDPRLMGRNPDSRFAGKNNAGAQNGDAERLPETGVAAAPDEPVANEPNAPAGNARPRESVNDFAASPSANPAALPDEEKQNTASSANAPVIDVLEESTTKPEFPRGFVSVSSSSYPSLRIPSELSSEAALSSASLQIGAPLSRPDPIYPEEAERQGVEGTVKLRLVIGKDGAVQNVEGISGPTSLAPASVSAVRQWRYRPTFLGDRPIEVSEEITIVFRLANPTTTGNSQFGSTR